MNVNLAQKYYNLSNIMYMVALMNRSIIQPVVRDGTCYHCLDQAVVLRDSEIQWNDFLAIIQRYSL